MPIDVVRFGVGHRRPQGPPGTKGIAGQVIDADTHGVIAELAFSRNGRITPHSNPNRTWFIVIEGGGWVLVGDERVRVQAGEAVLWPPDVEHAAWTDRTTMRAIVVEFALEHEPGVVLDGVARPALRTGSVTRGDGALRPRRIARERIAPGADDGEPT